MSNIPSIRKARHDARNGVSTAIANAMAPVNEALAGFFGTLKGTEGYTPEEQSDRLKAASEIAATLPQALLAAAQALAADPSVPGIAADLNDAAAFAVTRDFEAWQAKKAEAGDGALPSLDGDGFDVPEPMPADILGFFVG